MQETQWAGKTSWRRAQQPTLVFLPGKSHQQRSLGGYSPWGRKKIDMTECTWTGIGSFIGKSLLGHFASAFHLIVAFNPSLVKEAVWKDDWGKTLIPALWSEGGQMIPKVLIRNSIKQNKYGLLATRNAGHKDQTNPHRRYYRHLPSSCLYSPDDRELIVWEASSRGLKHWCLNTHNCFQGKNILGGPRIF